MGRQLSFRKSALALCAGLAATASAAIAIDFVPVGDAGNLGDTQPQGTYGAVAYGYSIDKYEVTNGQYIAFLNAVAQSSDPHGLYATGMGATYGGITQVLAGGSYSYHAKNNDANWLSRPVNFVDWYDTLRFANWLQNGQPTGAQDATTTEDGAYDMSLGAAVVRKPGARFFLPSEDEWYKAAFYKGGSTSAGYSDYATQSDAAPTAVLPPGTTIPPGSANWKNAVGGTYYTTTVGAYTDSPSAYGTFDQDGNLWEWTEALMGSSRNLRGGYWGSTSSDYLNASYRNSMSPTTEYNHTGFRVAAIPEPATLTLLVLAGLVLRRQR